MTDYPSRRHVLKATLATSGLLLAGRIPATAAVRRLRVARGVNTFPWFSLTREFPAPRTDYAWPPFQTSRPVPTRNDLDRLRRSGLDFIRIPVDPGPFLAGSLAQRESLLAMLMDAVGLALDARLKVIVNLQANGATHYWNPYRLLSGPDAPGFAAYLELVSDIAARLRRFPPEDIGLEPINEPMQACASDVWPTMQWQLLEAARRASPDVTLVATGACGSMLTGLDALDPAPLAAFEPLIFTFHFYEPYLFSHQGAPWMQEPVYRDLNAVPWPAREGSLEQTLAAVRKRMAADTGISPERKAAAYAETVKVLKVYFDADPGRPYIDHYLDMATTWAKRHGISSDRILMGEFGALRTDARYVAAGANDRARYIRDVRESAEAHGFAWAFWNLFDGMGMIDDVTRRFDPAITEALGLIVPRG